jgi:ADP-heptose:LPS heptosyltransferase
MPKLTDLPSQSLPSQPYIVIIPGASRLPKAWLMENFTTVANKLVERFDFEVILCGSASERSLCAQISDSTGNAVINLAGDTNLTELIKIIRGAAIVIANDSGSIHIAAATNTPSVCVLGGGHYGRFLPYHPSMADRGQHLPRVLNEAMDCYGCSWRCKHLSSETRIAPCITTISVDQVYAQCLELLLQRYE